MNRYFVECAYDGTNFNGWQKQANDDSRTVQGVMEKAFETLLRTPTPIVGCGRTDAGVHADRYFAHFDAEISDLDKFTFQCRRILPKDIGIYIIHPVHEDAHARFDAVERSYTYYLATEYHPFYRHFRFYYPQGRRSLDLTKLQEVADIFCKYQHFLPFCKTNGGNLNFRCDVRQASWSFQENEGLFVFRVSADRFLRGMIRLMVGTCIRYSEGKIHLDDIIKAMEDQTPITHIWSVPAEGLMLHGIRYPYLEQFRGT